jgi:type IV secretion system protein VirD4
VTLNRYRDRRDDSNLAWTAALAAVLAGFVLVRWLAHAGALILGVLAAVVLVALLASWALVPARRLPRNRVRDMRLRARLRLYPGRGHATMFELWLRWGRVAAARRARRSRPSLSPLERIACPAETSVLVARAQYNHACRVPVEEHVIFIAPPRAGKTGALADVIVHHPGAVVATTTRGDLHAPTAEIRAARGPVYVFNPQQLADVPSTMRWDMLAGCEDPATATRRAEPLAAIAAPIFRPRGHPPVPERQGE